jgi:uncharacterized protein (TIGR03437 family)
MFWRRLFQQDPVAVTVMNSGGTSEPVATAATQYGPAFFLWPNNQVVATHQDGSYSVKAGTFSGIATVPAAPGEVIICGLPDSVPAIRSRPPGSRFRATKHMPPGQCRP